MNRNPCKLLPAALLLLICAAASADDPGITKARLIQKSRQGYVLEVDVTQALGRVPLDLQGVDLIISSTHKWLLGSHGGGLVGVPADRADEWTAPAGGWFNLANAFDADRFERTVTKRLGHSSDERLLVLDATTGQNGVAQAERFHEAISLTGLVLTKLDSTAKGGVVLAIRETLDLPILYIGVGETADDLHGFSASDFVEALFVN